MIYGGMLVARPTGAARSCAFMREYMADAPEDLGGGVAFVSAPPEPFVPPEMHFKPIAASWCAGRATTRRARG